MSIINGTLIKFETSEQFIALTTCCRAHGRKGRFLIDQSKFAEWFSSGEGEHYERDCGSYLNARWSNGGIFIELLWYHRDTGDFTLYATQKLVLPAEVIAAAIDRNPVRYLYVEQKGKVTLDFKPAAETVRAINIDKRKRRAFVKALRRSFQWWRSTSITFYRDSPKESFFFREKDGICGGLILHERKKQTKAGEFPYREYSMHT